MCVKQANKIDKNKATTLPLNNGVVEKNNP